MSNNQQNEKFGITILVVALFVMLSGGVLMWNLLQESGKQPRPQTPIRYLKSDEAEANPPANFNAPKVDEDHLIP